MTNASGTYLGKRSEGASPRLRDEPRNAALPVSSLTQTLPALLAGFADNVPDVAIGGVEMDSRRVAPGQLFLACRGHAHHGLDYLEQALRQGAAAVAWEPAPDLAVPSMRVPAVAVESLSTRAGIVAARYWGNPSAQMFTMGITGTDGKTSTAYLIAQALERLGENCTYLGTLGYGRVGRLDAGSHTTPDPVQLQRLLAQSAAQGARAAAMEVSSHALDQDRIAGVEFDVAVLTNLGRDHLDYHGDLAHYAAAKHRLFRRPELSAVVLNRDDAYGRAWAHEIGHGPECLLYGLGPCPLMAERHVLGRELHLHERGLDFEVHSNWGKARLSSRLLGRFNAYNLLAALSVLLFKGVDLPRAVDALSQAQTVPGRVEGFRGPKVRPLVVVDYAHTPQALEQALKALRAHVGGKLHCVFGCGGDRDRGKRPLMGAAAAQYADALIITDDNPRSEDPARIVDEIRAGLPAGYPARVIHDRAEAISVAVGEAGAQDVVLVAGKGHEDYQIYGSDVRKFSDRAFVAALVGLAGNKDDGLEWPSVLASDRAGTRGPGSEDDTGSRQGWRGGK